MKFYCDQCHTKYQIADEKVAGKTVRMKCRKCGSAILIKGQDAEAPADNLQYDPLSGAPIGWHVAINGAPAGPYDLEQLRLMASNGTLDLQSVAWRDGMSDWKPIPEIPEIYSVLTRASVRPPPPQNPFEAPRASVPPPAPKPLGVATVSVRGESSRQAELAAQQAEVLAREQAEFARQQAEARAQQEAEQARQRAEAEQARLQAETKARQQAEFARLQAESHAREQAEAQARQLAESRARQEAEEQARAKARQQTARAQLPSEPRAPGQPQGPAAGAALMASSTLSDAPTMGIGDNLAHLNPFAAAPAAPINELAAEFSDRHPFAATELANFAPAGVPAPIGIAPSAMVSSSSVVNPPSSALAPSQVLPVKSSGKNAIIGVFALLIVGLGGAVFYLANKKPEKEVITETKVVEVTKTVTVEVPTAASGSPAKTPDKRPTSGGAAAPQTASNAAAAPAKSTGKVDLSDLAGTAPKKSGLGDLAGPSAGPSNGSGGGGGSMLTSSDIQSVVAARGASMRRHCIEKSSGGSGTSKVVAHLVISPNGNVQSVKGDGNDPEMARCVESQIRGWQFPPPGTSTPVDIPFTFVRQ